MLRAPRKQSWLAVSLVAALLCGAGSDLPGVCGPFTDVSDAVFCPFVLEIFTLGITTGTSPTTYDPTSAVSRLQMAAFLSRTVDGVLKRGSRRAALDQFWTPQNTNVLGLTSVGSGPALIKSDGADLWVTNGVSDTVIRVRASDGKLLESWTGATAASGVLVAMGKVFGTGLMASGALYRLDPSQPAGAVTTVSSTLGGFPLGMAFDGARIWTANRGGSVSIVTPGASIPWTVTTVAAGFLAPFGALFDGANVWVTDSAATLLKLNANGAILQTVVVGQNPQFPLFDGSNIWVPNFDSASVSVVRASSGAVLATLTGNGLDTPQVPAFDGQRVLITSQNNHRVCLWKAADLTPLGSFDVGAGTNPYGAASDGINFWIALLSSSQLVRF